MKMSFTASLVLTCGLVQAGQQPLTLQPLTLGSIPQLGFGTWNLDKSNASEAVSWAIQAGYRHIDCAAAYGNEVEVGRGIKHGLEATGIRREDLWITSKLWNDHHGKENVVKGLDGTLRDLGLVYLDLYHMHWPVEQRSNSNAIEFRDTWHAMTRLKHAGKVRHIGVSNFSPDQLRDLMKHSNESPDVHQMELHPYLQQSDWLAFHKQMGIHVTAYSPLAGTNPTYNGGDLTPLLRSEILKRIAKENNCTTAQVALKWGLTRGTSVIPKSQHKDRVTENFGALECDITKGDVEAVDGLGEVHHRFNNPSKGWGLKLYQGLENSKGRHGLHG